MIIHGFYKCRGRFLYNSLDQCLSSTSLKDQVYDNLFSNQNEELNLLSFFKTGQYIADFKFKVNRVSHQMTEQVETFSHFVGKAKKIVDHRFLKPL